MSLELHNEEGKTSEAANNRQQQMEKRMRKTQHLLINNQLIDEQHDEADILYIGLYHLKGQLLKVRTFRTARYKSKSFTNQTITSFPMNLCSKQ